MESKALETHDPLAMARERVQVGPIPLWAFPTSWDKTFVPKIRGQTTDLLIERHVNAEFGQRFVRHITRLETQHAVTTHSQWNLEFSPNLESIILHSIKTYRGDVEREHVSLEKIQFLQRESELEGLMLRGRVTLLLVLEDVSPGDILEYSYTLSRRSKIMPEHADELFFLPAGVEIGKYHFLVRHSERRALKWKSSSPKLEPQITAENGEVSWCWSAVQFASPAPEECVPPGHVMVPWIHISDCPDWQTVARTVSEAWKEDPLEDGLNQLVEEVTAFSPDLTARVGHAIDIVQDKFRYLSVINLELGGQIPALAGTIIRRRYGDCKDLAFLLVRLLRALGVSARPVLVNTVWQQFIGSLLPTPNIFDHVIAEFELGGEKRWVDCTRKYQGGGALCRHIPDFGLGLLIDAATTELAPVPKASLVAGSLDIKESLILDTSGGSSYFAVLITAKGPHADRYRQEFANQSFEAISKNRLQRCANQFYCKAARINQLEYRDEREINEFVFSEAFEITDWIKEDKASRTYTLLINGNVMSGALALPAPSPRREPFALPFPCNRTYTIEIECGSLGSISLPMVQIGNRFFSFSRRTRSWPKSLKLTFSLDTLASFVPAAEVPGHRKQVEAVWQAANVRLTVPAGYAKPRRRSDFGALPRKGPAPAVVPTTPSAPSLEKSVPIATEKIKTVLQGAPPAKPMPPAADGRQFQAAPENNPPSHRRSRKVEKRCATAFYLFLLCMATLVAEIPIARWNRGVGGGIALLVTIPSWICSLIFAVFGWKKLARFPGRYTDTSKIMATITFAFGGLLAMVFIPLMIVGFCSGIDRARGHYYPANGGDEVLDFKAQNFVFHTPSRPWQQVNGRTFGSKTTVAFRRPDPMGFTIVALPIEPMLLDPRKSVVELSKTAVRKAADLYSSKIVSEQEAVYNGVTGWRIETEASLQGHDTYFVQWICVTNGFGYQLTAWARTPMKSDLLDESSRLFADFEPVAPQK